MSVEPILVFLLIVRFPWLGGLKFGMTPLPIISVTTHTTASTKASVVPVSLMQLVIVLAVCGSKCLHSAEWDMIDKNERFA